MNYSLVLFYHGSVWDLFLLLFTENVLLSVLAVIMGILLLKTLGEKFQFPDRRERTFLASTILLNTVITYLGFLFWDKGLINISFSFDLSIFTDFIFVLLVMDFISWLFHFLMHRISFLNDIHKVSHSIKKVNPSTLFVIHPIEVLLIGLLWLTLLICFTFNIYSIILFLVISVILGVIANLGISTPATKNRILNLFISPAFRLAHHHSPGTNYGYYTRIWDNLFKTLSVSSKNFAKDTL